MHEPMAAAWLLAGAAACAFAGMAWLALAMPVHAQQAWGRMPAARQLRTLRWLGGLSVLAALALCLAVDHASMAVLVWVMLLAAAALVNAFVLSGRPGWLRGVAPWVRRSAA